MREVEAGLEKLSDCAAGLLGEILAEVPPAVLTQGILEDALAAMKTLRHKKRLAVVVQRETAGKANLERCPGLVRMKKRKLVPVAVHADNLPILPGLAMNFSARGIRRALRWQVTQSLALTASTVGTAAGR